MANVRYLVNDVDAALDFYVGQLGFELAERWGPPFAMVRRGDLTLWLSGPGTSAARPMPDGALPAPGAGTGWCSKWTNWMQRSMRCGAQVRISATTS
jgi:catechol 2,3-dioxygenase-like lactoylglutathione lyase family enzyme